jgi:hypothetical protein
MTGNCKTLNTLGIRIFRQNAMTSCTRIPETLLLQLPFLFSSFLLTTYQNWELHSGVAKESVHLTLFGLLTTPPHQMYFSLAA